MNKELQLWTFIRDQLAGDESVMLLVVADSSGSSPGRAGYKMAVGNDGELYGSIGGGVMEVELVERSRALLSEPGAVATGFPAVSLVDQVHQKNSPNSSGMICSGRQKVILQLLVPDHLERVDILIEDLENGDSPWLVISETEFKTFAERKYPRNFMRPGLERTDDTFNYREKLDRKNLLYIIGGGHCALALSEIMSKLDFRINIFDDRPELNTLAKNRYADKITIIDNYERIGAFITSSPEAYVVVMTLGYKFDEAVIRELFDHTFRYFGVLGSKAKMATLMKALRDEGFDADRLAAIRTPIGLPIRSHSPEEIAVSIAAEIIQVKNSVQ